MAGTRCAAALMHQMVQPLLQPLHAWTHLDRALTNKMMAAAPTLCSRPTKLLLSKQGLNR